MITTSTNRMLDRVERLTESEIIRIMSEYQLGKNPFGSLLEEIAVKAKYEALPHNKKMEKTLEDAGQN